MLYGLCWARFSCWCEGIFKCRLHVVAGSACAMVPSPACHLACGGGWWHCQDAPTSFLSHQGIKVVAGCRS